MAKTETNKVTRKKADIPNAEDSTEKKPVSINWKLILKILWYSVIVGLLYYFIVWNRMLAETDTNKKCIITAAVSAVLLLLIILVATRHLEGYRIAPKTIVLLLIIFGPITSSLIFPKGLLTPFTKVCIVLFFSLLPGWLYLQFISTKGKTLWDEYVINLFRLHVDHYAHLPQPPEGSIFYSRWVKARKNYNAVHEGQGIYEKKFSALFGALPSEVGSLAPGDALNLNTFRAQAEKLGPVALATLIISVGWVLVVEPGSVAEMLRPAEELSMTDSSDNPAATLLIPPYNSFCFAFLGAYFYIVQMLVRRYFQNDLKTPAYIHATLRIIIVILLVWVVDLLLRFKGIDEEPRLGIAFVIGVFPYVGWQALQALIRLPFQFVVPALRRKHPLSDLDGLNIWYESRLLEEGVEDIQNLATADLVDVILNTRIPVDRLVDWVDQSLLYLHLSNKKVKNARGKESDREKLRRFGIRTATDLDDAFKCDECVRKDFIVQLERLLNTEEELNEPSVLRCIQATFQDEPNLYHVRQWKGFSERELKPETIHQQAKQDKSKKEKPKPKDKS